MNLEASLKRLVSAFDAAGVDFALIGGLALAAHELLRRIGR